MANETKKYASLDNLQTFKENIDEKFVTKVDANELSKTIDKKLDASNYVIDSALSSTSENPVQNKVINEEFDAIAVAMNALELAIDDKADAEKVNEIDTTVTKIIDGTTPVAIANNLGTETVGGETQPIYLLDGVAQTTRKYAGGTLVNMNASELSGSKATFFAPTNGGTSGYILRANGQYGSPSWIQKVPIANGGTNATTASDARTNLEVYSKDEVNAELVTKSDTNHTHVITDVENLESSLNAKVSTTTTVNSKALSSNITLSASDVGADVSGSASSALSSAKTYTDEQVATKTLVQMIIWGDDD